MALDATASVKDVVLAVSRGRSLGQSPGPIYLPKAQSLGAQYVSTKATSPRATIGLADRFPYLHSDDIGPGPGAYNRDDAAAFRGPSYSVRAREAFGTLAGGNNKTPGPGTYPRLDTSQTTRRPPAYSLRARTGSLRPQSEGPGPNAHQLAETMPIQPKQPLSTKPSIPGYRFGRSARDADVGASSARGAAALPGPADYDATKATFKVTKHKTVPAYSLSFRHKDLTDPTVSRKPQPELRVVPAGLGPQPLSHRRSAPALSLSGRTKFGSPYDF